MLVSLIAVLSLLAAPQQAPAGGMSLPPQRQQPRDPATEKKGTASVKGRITAADTGRPLRRVQVRVSAPELTEARSTSTNLQGAYEFADLPAGRYTNSVSRNGYLSLQYGQRRPGEPPKPLQVADGQAIDKLDFALPRSGVISGRLSDETGDAFAGEAAGAWVVDLRDAGAAAVGAGAVAAEHQLVLVARPELPSVIAVGADSCILLDGGCAVRRRGGVFRIDLVIGSRLGRLRRHRANGTSEQQADRGCQIILVHAAEGRFFEANARDHKPRDRSA